jgi:phage terminase large subunit GpA-like protein
MQTNNFSEKQLISDLLTFFTPIEDISTRTWSERELFLSEAKSPSNPGRYNALVTPYMLHVMQSWDNPEVDVIVAKKSAQIGWSQTILNCIFKSAVHDNMSVLLGFPRDGSNASFFKTQILPILRSNPVLLKQLSEHLNKISYKFIPFHNSFIMSGNMATPGDLKSVAVTKVVIEEPDDAKKDVSGQGDAIDLLRQRIKTIPYGAKIVFGGTPTNAEFSQVDRAYKKSNRMHFQVPCHKCGEFHSLSFDNLKCLEWAARRIDEQYGAYDPETAYYECPHCTAVWTDDDRRKNIVEALNFHNLGWKAEVPSLKNIVGYAFNELLSPFKSSSHVELAKSMLEAEVAYEQGHEGLLKSFINNRKGEAYAPKTQGLGLEELKAQRLNYTEGIIPNEGLILTCGIDVQRGKNGRFAIVVRAWGRNGNSWLVQWTEITAKDVKNGGDTEDASDPIWDKLEDYLDTPFQHESGKKLYIAAAAIDARDGAMTEVVYQFVRKLNLKWETQGSERTLSAVMGTGELKYTTLNIYNEPAGMDLLTFGQQRKSLAERYGIVVYQIGAFRAHEEVLRRFNIQGTRDRHFHCKSNYPGYEEGILSCRKTFASETVKAIFKQIPGKKKEAIDCEKMALWCSYFRGIRNMTTQQWEERERLIYGNKV